MPRKPKIVDEWKEYYGKITPKPDTPPDSIYISVRCEDGTLATTALAYVPPNKHKNITLVKDQWYKYTFEYNGQNDKYSFLMVLDIEDESIEFGNEIENKIKGLCCNILTF